MRGARRATRASSEPTSMTDMRRTLLWVVFVDVARPSVGRVEQAHRPAVDVRPPARAARQPRPAAAAPAPTPVPSGGFPAQPRRRRRARRAGRGRTPPRRPLPRRRRRQRRPSRSRSRPTWSRPRSTAAAARWCGSSCCSSVDPIDRRRKHVVLFDRSRERLYLAADRPGAAHGRRRPAQPPHADARPAGRAHARRRRRTS